MGESREEAPGNDVSHLGLRDVERPQEIDSVHSFGRVGDSKVDTNVDSSAGAFTTKIRRPDPSPPTGETSEVVAVSTGEVDPDRVNEGTCAERAGNGENWNERDGRHIPNNPSSLAPPEDVGTTGTQYEHPVAFHAERAPALYKSREAHFIDISGKEHSKVDELDSKEFAIARSTSNFSVESGSGDQCRICQQHAEEPLMELGCRCRGELAKAHRSCIDHWFGNKGTNKCEVCQHVATNVPLPASQPTPHFWVWRIGGAPYNGVAPRRTGVGPLRLNPLPVRPVLLVTLRRHPTIMVLWLLLFAFMAYLFVDVTDSASIGYAAMPIGFLFGVLVVLGLGTAARLVLECWHERAVRRNIQRMENEPNFEGFPVELNNVNIEVEPTEAQSSTDVHAQASAVHSAGGTPQVAPQV